MILYIGNIISSHGKTPTTIETLSKLFRGEGYDVETASDKQNKSLRLLDMLYAVWNYRKQASVVLIDTYSTANFYYAFLVAKLCQLLKMNYIPILHGGDLEHRLKNSPRMSESIFSNAHVLVSPSLFLKEVFAKYGYADVVQIPNNIQIDSYIFKNRGNVRPRLLWVRSFADIYNPLMAVRVLKELLDQGYDATLCMIGPEKDGALQRSKDLARQLGVRITFTGLLSLEEWTRKSQEYDIFINTSNYDNMPVSLVEAMALGLPVVSTNVGGIPLLIQDEEDGLLVANDDVHEMVAAIKRLLQQPQLASTITENAREKAARFDWSYVREQWKEILAC